MEIFFKIINHEGEREEPIDPNKLTEAEQHLIFVASQMGVSGIPDAIQPLVFTAIVNILYHNGNNTSNIL